MKKFETLSFNNPTCQQDAVVRAPGRCPPPPEELRHGSTPWRAAGPARWFPERRRWGRGNPPGRPRAKDRTRRTSEDTWSWTLRTRPKDLLQVGEARELGTCETVRKSYQQVVPPTSCWWLCISDSLKGRVLNSRGRCVKRALQHHIMWNVNRFINLLVPGS